MPDLGLQFQAGRHFGFLVQEKGYKCTESTPYCVRFESPTTFVELAYDGNRSFEVSLIIGMMRAEDRSDFSFSLDEILRFFRAPEAKKYSLIQVTSTETLASSVEQLSKILQQYAADLIAGDKTCFAEIAEHRRKEAEEYAMERDLRNARAEAEAAWHRKDYSRVVKALKPLRNALTPSEVRKLKLSEEKSGQ